MAETGAQFRSDSSEQRVGSPQEELARRERELTILATVASHVHGQDDVRTILEVAIDDILQGLGLRAAWVFLGRETDRRLHLAASQGVSAEYLDRVAREGLEECLCCEVFATGQRMLARNTTQCPRMPTLLEGQREPVAHACIPLLLEGRSRGVLNVAARPGELFEEPELRFLETVAHQISLAVERARHLAAERLFNSEARALTRIHRAIGGSLELRTVLKAVGDSALEILGARQALILFGERAGPLEVAYVAAPPHPALEEGHSIDFLGEDALLRVDPFALESALAVGDLAADDRANPEVAHRWHDAAAIVAPLAARGRGIGLLIVSRPVVHEWTDEEVEVAEALAAQAAVALENARLYHQARRAYRELKEAQARLVQGEKMATLGTFASGLAHEVRNPLNSISLQLSRLERKTSAAEPALAAEVSSLTRIIREEIRRLDDLVGDFLLFSRPNRAEHRPTSLETLVEEVVSLLGPEARAAGVTLETRRVAEPLPPLRLDANGIKQVLINLLRNAIEAMPEGGRAVLESGLLEGRARVTVSDSGPGLPEGLDIFQLFVTTKPGGTGLGLAIAQQIVLEHGGELTARGGPGQGATFALTLPVKAAAAEGEEEAP